MNKRLVTAVVVLAGLVNGSALAKQEKLTAIYSDSGRTLEHVQRSDTGDKVVIGSPLWLVSTEADGMISSVDFIRAGGSIKESVFKHDKSGLVCTISTKAEGNFIRHFYTLKATKPVVVKQFVGTVLSNEFSAGGTVPGSPLVKGDWFASMEYPTAQTLERMDTEIGTWNISMLKPKEFKELTYPISDKLVKGDSLDVQFTYQSGWSRLDIRKVALFKGDKLVAEDVHDGFAGTPTSNNIYKLDISSLSKNQRTGLHVIADVMAQGQSNGFIHVKGGKLELLTQYADCNRELTAGDSLEYSSVIGHAVFGSLRRGVLEYVEAVRPRKYKPFLNYNSWYDICEQGSDGTFVMDSDQCLDVMKAWETDFIKPYGVEIDCFVFDDGWDDYDNLWRFNTERFPDGFRPQAKLAKKMKTGIGTWMSPFGGYGDTKAARLKSARRDGFEINSSGLSLSGEKYYKRFYDTGVDMIKNNGVNSFKFDGVGGGSSADMEAACHLMDELREIDPNLYISLTVGSWGSPFFLLHGDSIFRGGGDAHHYGDKGPASHRWMNYRDGETYKNVIKPSPLYPINSLMVVGMVYSQYGLGRTSVDKTDKSFADQAWSFFASGTQMQELYMSQKVMNKRKWSILADAIKWAHANAQTLRDTHWIGGDPYQYQVYGQASFDYRGVQKDQPYKAIV
ncbi:MAG: alpha-amylase family protein, partial [Planctomycetota bacterium]